MSTSNLFYSIRLLSETKHYSDVVQEILSIVLQKYSVSTILYLDYIDAHGIQLKDIKGQTMDVILDYAELILEDDYLSDIEIQNIRILRNFFCIEDGEFLEYGKRERVESILVEQLEKLYADNKIDKDEMLHKSELQGLFGLGYDDYQEIVNKVAIEAYSRGADIRDLDTYL